MPAAARRTSYQATFLVLTAAISAFSLLQSLVIPVLPTIQESLGTTQSTVTWVLTGYLLSASVFTPILGRIGDMIGKERVFVGVLVALAVGSLLAALATSVEVMIVARVIQGIGGGVLPLSFGIIRDEFPAERVAGAVGAMAALTAGAAGLGIVLAGPIVESLNYHWLFWIPMVVVVIAAVAAHRVIPPSPIRTPGRVGVLAPVLLSAALIALLLAVSRGPHWGWDSGRVLGLFAAAVVLAYSWVRVELRSEHPLIDMHMMRVPAVWTTNLVALLIGIGMYANFAFLPQFLQTDPEEGYGFGVGITGSGVMLLPLTVFMFLFGISVGRLARRLGSKPVLVLGCALAALPFLFLALEHTEKWHIVVANAVMGAGFGLAFAAMSSLVVAAVPPSQTGVASGMNANIRTIGGSIGSAVMASIVTSALAADGIPKESGYTTGFAVLGIATIVAMLAAMLIPSAREQATRAGARPGSLQPEPATAPAGPTPRSAGPAG